ncbi:MAG: cell division protein FtsA [Candidatus Roizmanbacteria bacterium]
MSDQLITGIDIGTNKIGVVIAQLGEDELSPRIMGFSSVDSKGVRRGQIVDINQVTDSIEKAVEQAERMAGAKVQNAYVTVGGPHIESLNSQGVVAVSSPDVEISGEDVNRVVEAAKAISLSSTREVIEVIPREFIVDGQPGIKNPVGMTGVRLEVNTHIITASLTNLRNVERSLSDLGISVVSYVFSGLSSALSSVTETEKELGVALIDVGGGKTDIAMYIDGSLSYSSSIPIGAKHVTNDIAVGLRVSLESAEKIKKFISKHEKQDHEKEHQVHRGHFGRSPEVSKSKDDFDISSLHLPEGLNSLSHKTVTDGVIRPRVEELFSHILDHIDKSGFATAIPSGLVITGGGALTYGVLDGARRVVGLPARIGIPTGLSGLVDEVMFPQYASTAGLLLYAAGYKKEGSDMSFKDFDKILKNFRPSAGVKKIKDLFKSFLP